MHAGRIAVILEHDLCHKLRHLGIDLGGGGVIKIYFFHLFTSCYACPFAVFGNLNDCEACVFHGFGHHGAFFF